LKASAADGLLTRFPRREVNSPEATDIESGGFCCQVPPNPA
jgi:hypothetical protein